MFFRFAILIGLVGVAATVRAQSARLDTLGDPLPDGALARLGSNRFHHGENVQKVFASPDGKHVVSAGHNHKLWELTTGRSQPFNASMLVRPKSSQYIVVIGAWKNRLAMIVIEKGIPKIVDVVTGDVLGLLPPEKDNRYQSFALRPDGEAVAFMMLDPLIRGHWMIGEWKVKDDKIRTIGSFPETNSVTLGGYSSDGTRLATHSYAGQRTDVWDTSTGRSIISVTNPPDPVAEQFTFTGDGKLFAHEYRKDRAIRLWDAKTGKELKPIVYEDGYFGKEVSPPSVLVASPNGKYLAHRTEFHFYRIFDVTTRKVVRDLKCRGFIGLSAAFSADSKRLVTGEGDDLFVYDVATGAALDPDRGASNIAAIAWSPEGKRVATGGGLGDATGRIWDATTGRLLNSLVGHTNGFASLAWSPDGRTMTSASFDRTIRVWSAEGKSLAEIAPKDGYPSYQVFDPTGQFVCVGGQDFVHVIDVKLNRVARQIPIPLERPSLAMTPDGKQLIAARDARMVTFDFATGKELGRQEISGGSPRADYLNTANFLVTRRNGSIELWDRVDGRPLRTLVPLIGENHQVSLQIAISPDGRLLAHAYGAAEVKVVEICSGVPRFTFHSKSTLFNSFGLALRFAPEGTRLAATESRSTLIWDVATASKLPANTEAAWADLKSANGTVGYAAIRFFHDRPADAVRMFTALKPIAPPDEAKTASLIKQLDSPRFAEREAASKSLLAEGDRVIGPVKAALKATSSAELRQRIEAILAETGDSKSLTGEALRTARAIEALERIGSKEARAILKNLAAGAGDAVQTREAASALGRLERK